GRPAYEAEAATALILAIGTGPVPDLTERRPEVPSALAHAVARAMSKDPKDRFRDLGELAQAIAPFGGADASKLARAIGRTLHGADSLADAETQTDDRALTVEARAEASPPPPP